MTMPKNVQKFPSPHSLRNLEIKNNPLAQKSLESSSHIYSHTRVYLNKSVFKSPKHTHFQTFYFTPQECEGCD